MVTADLAVALPVLVFILGLALAAQTITAALVRAHDGAAEAARAAARGDDRAARSYASQLGPAGSTLAIEPGSTTTRATVRFTARPLGGLLGGFTFTESAVAATEPASGSP